MRAWLRSTLEILGLCLAAWLIIAAPACSGGSVPAILTAADAIDRGAAQVLGWCEANGASPTDVAQAAAAAEKGDMAGAFTILDRLVAERGAPQDVRDLLVLAEGAYAAKAVQDGMRALSGGGDGG